MSAPLDPTEKTLRSLGCAYTREADGTYIVKGDIKITYERLTELPDLSNVIVQGNFYCNDNRLTSLKGAPREVTGDFWCHFNSLTSLEGAPKKVGDSFWCHNNDLTTLAHAPQEVGGYFYCNNMKDTLRTLEGAPRKFKELHSDFGTFTAWDDIPAEVRFTPETRLRMAEEKASQSTLEQLKKVANDHKIKLKKPGMK
jgi:hypothetical protein